MARKLRRLTTKQMKDHPKTPLYFVILAGAAILALLHPFPASADEITTRFYRVKNGDTIAKIAAAFAISPADIIDKNHLRQQGDIYAGEELILPLDASAVAPTAQADEDANSFFDRLRGNFDDIETFDKVAKEARDSGTAEQTITELRLLNCVKIRAIPALQETLAKFEKMLPNWKETDSPIFKNRMELDGFLHLAHGIIDQAVGDTTDYDREMNEAFRITPNYAKLYGRIIVEGHSQRGLILDINQKTLADNTPARTVVADGVALTHLEGAVAVLAGPLRLDVSELRRTLSSGRKYIVLKKHVPEAAAKRIEDQLKAHSVYGITFEQEAERIYPNGSVASHVVGFVNVDQDGVQGIEAQEDQYLRGHDGFRSPDNHREAPQDGNNVRLTIDLNLQNIVESELDKACAEFKPKKAIVILMRPQTGEILAMANRPNFDPNDLHEKPAADIQEHFGDMKNCAITDEMELGPIFMIVPAAGALNEHLVQPDSTIFCENGAFRYGGHYLHDSRPWGDLTTEEILEKSSKIGGAKLAIRLGEERLYEYIQAFGFGERTGVPLPGEIRGTVYSPRRWTKVSITRIPIGYEVAVTPIQMITAMCAIANGGHLMMPQIVHDITDRKGALVKSFPPVEVRQVVSGETAREVTDVLKSVVSRHGTAPLATVPGFTVAGKTGTAEKADGKGSYMPGQYVVSFCGYLPADNPAFVCLVILDDAQTRPEQNYGGMVAAPIFARIAEKVANYMSLTPDSPRQPLP